MARLLAIATVLLAASTARANPMDVFGFGARSSSMGGAVTADVEDFSANYYNPAGLVRGDELRLSVGYFMADMDMEVNGVDSRLETVRGLTFGVVAPGSFGDVDFAFGLGGHLNDHLLSRTLGRPPDEVRWIQYDNRPHRIFLSTHLALRPVDWLLIGGGIAFQSRSQSVLGVRGEIAVDAGEASSGAPSGVDPEAESRLEHSLQSELTTIRYPQVGVQIVPREDLSFGVVYRGEFDLRVRLEAEVDANLDARFAPGMDGLDIPAYFSLLSDSINAFQPQQVSFGGRWKPLDRLSLNAEVTWMDWSAYRSPIGRSEVDLDIRIPDGLPVDLDIPDEVQGSDFIDANFEDRWVPRVGIEYAAVREPAWTLDVRAGYFYEKSPMPHQIGLTNFVDTDRHAVSAGLGAALRQLEPTIDGWIRLDAFFQYSYLPERETIKQSLVNPAGDYRARGHIFTGGATVELAFE
ncbi:MAG: OmpP1/FadL family transporter [Myxococcota bacterium]